MYERNLLVETKYNIDIKAYATEQGEYLTEMVRNNNNNGLHLYDIVTPMMNEAVALAAEDALYDLYSSEISADLDLTKPWWPIMTSRVRMRSSRAEDGLTMR